MPEAARKEIGPEEDSPLPSGWILLRETLLKVAQKGANIGENPVREGGLRGRRPLAAIFSRQAPRQQWMSHLVTHATIAWEINCHAE
ncbi:MAG TPA: hypothetical protein VF099_06880 [Ktedonobacterales bacterium]